MNPTPYKTFAPDLACSNHRLEVAPLASGTHPSGILKSALAVLSRHVVLACLVFLPLTTARAQPDTAAASRAIGNSLASRYIGKTLTLRQFYKDNTIRYRPDGKSQAGQETGTWTLYGLLKIFDVTARKNELELRGKRQVVLIHQPDGAMQQSDSRTVVRIVIEFDPAKSVTQQVGMAMDQIFLTADETVADVVPSYWKEYFQFRTDMAKAGLPLSAIGSAPIGATSCNPLRKADVPKPPASDVDPPRLLQKVDPKYPNEARNLKLEGTVILRGIIQKNGHFAELKLLQAVGAGFDEAAMDAASDWVFTPRRVAGNPSETESCVQISFRQD